MSMTFLPCGDAALVVQLGDRIEAATNARVIALAALVQAARDGGQLAGVSEIVPTYRSLLISYDPRQIRGAALETILRGLAHCPPAPKTTARHWQVPCLYGGAVGQDLGDLAQMKNLTPQQLIDIHAATPYRVYMIGFAPGFAYLGGQPAILDTPRLPEPRQNIARGAIGIGGQQGSINSVAGPSGWRYLGWTPLRSFDPARAEPFLFRAGDHIRFHPITSAEAQELDARSAAGEIIATPQEIPL